MPLDLSVNEPKRSFCPLCKSPIHWFDNLPVVSWLLLRAKCRSCKCSISWRYPFVELLTAVFFFLAFYEFLPELPQPMDYVSCGFLAILFANLVAISYIDFDHRIIPDELNVSFAMIVPWAAMALPRLPIDSAHVGVLSEPLSHLGIAEATLSPGVSYSLMGLAALLAALLSAWVFRAMSLAPVDEPDPKNPIRRSWWDTRWAFSLGAAVAYYCAGIFLIPEWVQTEPAQSMMASLVGTAAGAGILYAIGVVGSWVFRKQAMGFGDVKFLALLGGVLGWQAVGLSLFIACVLGSVIGIGARIFTKDSYIPFGPFLAMGAVTLILWSDYVQAALNWYLALFNQQPLVR